MQVLFQYFEIKLRKTFIFHSYYKSVITIIIVETESMVIRSSKYFRIKEIPFIVMDINKPY